MSLLGIFLLLILFSYLEMNHTDAPKPVCSVTFQESLRNQLSTKALNIGKSEDQNIFEWTIESLLCILGN